MKKLLLIVLALLGSALGQGVRVGDGHTVTTVIGTGAYPAVGAVPSAGISFCTAPANAVPCTNKAVTFTDQTLATPCATATQVVLAGTTNCVGTADQYGNWGVWVVAGQYEYTVTNQDGASTGPFPVTAAMSNGHIAEADRFGLPTDDASVKINAAVAWCLSDPLCGMVSAQNLGGNQQLSQTIHLGNAVKSVSLVKPRYCDWLVTISDHTPVVMAYNGSAIEETGSRWSCPFDIDASANIEAVYKNAQQGVLRIKGLSIMNGEAGATVETLLKINGAFSNSEFDDVLAYTNTPNTIGVHFTAGNDWEFKNLDIGGSAASGFEPVLVEYVNSGETLGDTVSTTLGTAVAAGPIVTVTPASMTGIFAGMPLEIDTADPSLKETVLVLWVNGTTFKAAFAFAHSAAATVKNVVNEAIHSGKFTRLVATQPGADPHAGTVIGDSVNTAIGTAVTGEGIATVTPTTMAGIYDGMMLEIDSANPCNAPCEQVTVITKNATTFTAYYRQAHLLTATVKNYPSLLPIVELNGKGRGSFGARIFNITFDNPGLEKFVATAGPAWRLKDARFVTIMNGGLYAPTSAGANLLDYCVEVSQTTKGALAAWTNTYLTYNIELDNFRCDNTHPLVNYISGQRIRDASTALGHYFMGRDQGSGAISGTYHDYAKFSFDSGTDTDLAVYLRAGRTASKNAQLYFQNYTGANQWAVGLSQYGDSLRFADVAESIPRLTFNHSAAGAGSNYMNASGTGWTNINYDSGASDLGGVHVWGRPSGTGARLDVVQLSGSGVVNALNGFQYNGAAASGHLLVGDGTSYVDAVGTPSNVGLGNVTNDVQTKAAVVPNTAPLAGQILAGNAGNTAYAPQTVGGDCTATSAGAFACNRTINRQDTIGAITGNSGAQTVYTYSLASLASGACIEIETMLIHTGTNSVTYSVNVGTAALAGFVSTGAPEVHLMVRFCNNLTVTNAQRMWSYASMANTGSFAPGYTTSSQDMTSAKTITVQFNVASPDTVAGQVFTVRPVQ